MKTDRTEPMRIHKRLICLRLTSHPEEAKDIIPEWLDAGRTVEDYVRALRDDPREWFVDGALQDPDEVTEF